MGKDLGTYFLRVELMDGRGWIQTWTTGWRYTNGTANESPLDATAIPPTWDDDDGVLETMQYMFLDGNYACDCNRSLFWERSQQKEETDHPCGETMELKLLTAIRPDRTEVVIFERKPDQLGTPPK